jgi:hypothetical protein
MVDAVLVVMALCILVRAAVLLRFKRVEVIFVTEGGQ